MSGADSTPSFFLRVPSGSFIFAWDTRPISVLPHLQIDLEDHQNLKLVSDTLMNLTKHSLHSERSLLLIRALRGTGNLPSVEYFAEC